MITLLGGLLVLAAVLWPGQPLATDVLEREPRRAPSPVWFLPSSNRSRSSREEQGRALLQVLESIAPAVREGVPPARALAITVGSAGQELTEGDVADDLRRLAQHGAEGRALGPAWVELGRRHQLPALAQVGRAWTLSERMGCPLADALATATGGLRSRLEHERQLRTLTAGPRATMQLLSLLPVAGLALAMLIGVDPRQIYTGPVLLLAVAPGLALLVAGRLLVRAMVHRATRERRLP